MGLPEAIISLNKQVADYLSPNSNGLKLLETAANSRDPECQFLLGIAKEGSKEGIRMLRLAAKSGHPSAMNSLSDVLFKKAGEKDAEPGLSREAWYWAEKHALSGDSAGMGKLAHWLRTEMGDIGSAESWERLAQTQSQIDHRKSNPSAYSSWLFSFLLFDQVSDRLEFTLYKIVSDFFHGFVELFGTKIPAIMMIAGCIGFFAVSTKIFMYLSLSVFFASIFWCLTAYINRRIA
ncbi:MAG: hypothetical protein HQM09_08430 [Candidatus Riflebacteria bacterium]|nr:hypothetical protein [Candidatus Riflebacteria bacterium]